MMAGKQKAGADAGQRVGPSACQAVGVRVRLWSVDGGFCWLDVPWSLGPIRAL